jgi:hypothetical protein
VHLADSLCIAPNCPHRRLVCEQCGAEKHLACNQAGMIKKLSDLNQSIVVEPVNLDVVNFTNEVYKNITKELLALGSKLRSVIYAIGKTLQDEINVVNKMTMASLNYHSDKIRIVYDGPTNTVTASHQFEKEIMDIHAHFIDAFVGKDRLVWRSLEDHINRVIVLKSLPIARLTKNHVDFVPKVEAVLEATLGNALATAPLVLTNDDYMNLKVYQSKCFSQIEKSLTEHIADLNLSVNEDYNSLLNISARLEKAFFQDSESFRQDAPHREPSSTTLNKSQRKLTVDENGNHLQMGDRTTPTTQGPGDILVLKNWMANESLRLTQEKNKMFFRKISEQFDHSPTFPCCVLLLNSSKVTRFKIQVNSSFEDLRNATLEQTPNVLSPNGLQWLQFSLLTPEGLENLRATRLVEKNPGGPGRFRFMNVESTSSMPAVGRRGGMSRMVMFNPVITYVCEFVPGHHFKVFADEASSYITGLKLRRGTDYFLCLRFLYKENSCVIEELP